MERGNLMCNWMSRRHTDNWSHPCHYLVDPYTWPLSPNDHGLGHEWPIAILLCAMSIGPRILRYSYFKIWPWKSMVKVMCVVKGQGHVWPSKFKDQGYGQGQTHWSHLRPGVQSIHLLFVSLQSDHFWLRYGKFYIWPWKFKVKVIAKVKPDGHVWALEFNRYVCFSFRCNRTTFGWNIGNSIFDLENSGSRSRPRSKLMEFNRYACFWFRGNWTILAEI